MTAMTNRLTSSLFERWRGGSTSSTIDWTLRFRLRVTRVGGLNAWLMAASISALTCDIASSGCMNACMKQELKHRKRFDRMLHAHTCSMYVLSSAIVAIGDPSNSDPRSAMEMTLLQELRDVCACTASYAKSSVKRAMVKRSYCVKAH
jgi:hypothetical protein